jgi:hypothetical protein
MAGIDFYELLFDSGRKTADVATGLIGANQELFDALLEFTLKEEKIYTMRASRVVYLCAHHNPQLLLPHLSFLVKNIQNYKDESLKRNFGKILTEFTKYLNEDEEGILIDQCFKWILSPDEKVVIKIYGLDIIYEFTNKYPELKTELISSIEDQLPKNSIAFKSKGKKLLQKLYKEIR